MEPQEYFLPLKIDEDDKLILGGIELKGITYFEVTRSSTMAKNIAELKLEMAVSVSDNMQVQKATEVTGKSVTTIKMSDVNAEAVNSVIGELAKSRIKPDVTNFEFKLD